MTGKINEELLNRKPNKFILLVAELQRFKEKNPEPYKKVEEGYICNIKEPRYIFVIRLLRICRECKNT